jgi:glutamate:Na+ symporter, ESS family
MVALDAEQIVHVRAFLSVTAGIIVLFVGKGLNQRLALLREYNIPEPVTGGLLFSIAFGALYLLSGFKVDFDLTARDILLVYFFTVIGINARVEDLVRGGKPLVALLAVAVAFMFAENLAGVGMARLLGLDPSVGLLTASISMTAGFIGFGLGATPTAMANMTAVTQRHGPSHLAFLVVPLVGAFFIDIANALTIQLFLAAL